MELALDRGQVGVDVGVVEFEIIQDQGARAVMDELGALVEERAVVFVGLDHEKRGIPQARTDPEIAGDPADQKAGAQPRVFKNPGEHAGGRGLAVGTGHRQHPAITKDVFGQPLRARGVGQPAIQQGLDDGHAAAHYITDHDGPRVGQRVGVVALVVGNPGLFQLVAHGRVQLLVGTRDRIPLRARQLGQPAHEGPANPEDVELPAGHWNNPIAVWVATLETTI